MTVPRIRWLLVALALVVPAAPPLAASESIFGLQFLGSSDETGDARARGLGVMGVALDDSTTAIATNAAAYGALRYATFSFMAVAGSRATSTADDETREGFARFPQVRFAVPLFGKVVVATGFSSLRNVHGGFELESRSVDGLGYTQRFERDGSLWTLPVAVAASLGSHLRLGVGVDFLLGTIDEQWVTAGDSLLTLATRRRDEVHGTSVHVGIMAVPWRWLRLGVSWAPEFTANRERRTTLEDATPGSTADPIRDTLEEADMRFPQVLRGGATVRFNRKWLVAGDALWRDWSQYTGSLYEADRLDAETRLGGGIEYRVGPWSYCRAGVSRWTWGYDVGGDAVRETALHFGAGVPLAPGRGGVHLALEHAWIGSLEANGHEERTWRVVVSVSGQETWLRKSPRSR